MQHFHKPVAAICLAVASAFVHAQDAVYDFAIPAQPADQAIELLSRQTGLQPFFTEESVKGIRSNSVKGRYTLAQALDQLLAGTGLEYLFTAEKAVAIRTAARRQTAAPDTLLPEILVTTSTRTANPLSKTAASISVVDSEMLDERQAATASQVLKKLPNVEFGGGPRVNGEIPAIRGVFGPSITLMIDGARQNDSTSPGLKSPLFIDPYFLQRVEVLRGPASSLYGSGGNGGVMAFTTISARDLLSGDAKLGGGAKAAYNRADRSTRLNARAYAAGEVFDALLAVGSQDWNKIRQGGGGYLDPNDGDAATGMVKLGVQPFADARIELTHQFYKSDNLQVNNGQATQYRTANQPITMPAVQEIHVDQQNTVLKASFGKVDDSPAVLATVYRTSLQYEADRSPDPAITNVLYSNTKTVTDGASIQGSRIVEGGVWGRHRLTAGGDYFKDKQTAVSATSTNPSAPSTVTRNGERQVGGVFLQDEIDLGSGWRLTPSLRSDHYSASMADGSLPGNSASRVSPKVSLAWDGGRGLMVYGNYGEAFRAPTVNELYQNFNGFGLTNFLPNASLKPEIDRTFELGTHFERKSWLAEGDKLRLRAAWFDSRVTDLIYSVNLGGMTPVGSTPAQQAGFAANCATTGLNCKLQFQNVPDARRRGGEIEVGYGIGQWHVNAAYSRVRVENRGNGDKLFSPPDKLSLQVRLKLPAQGTTLFWNTTGVAAQDYDSTLLRRRSGYSTHDLFATWVPANGRYKIDVGVSNLFDKRYSAYQSSNAFAYTYQEGRSLRLAVSADF